MWQGQVRGVDIVMKHGLERLLPDVSPQRVRANTRLSRTMSLHARKRGWRPCALAASSRERPSLKLYDYSSYRFISIIPI